MAQQGKLVLVSTPIGNIEDISYRAIKVLQEVDYILAEDTRITAKLLNYYDLHTPLKPFHQHNEHKKTDVFVNEILNGKVIALVTDAGTPGISDPGFLIIRACKEHNILIDAIPGAAAFIPALQYSGFPMDRFCFEGFLPHKKGRLKRIQEWENDKHTIVFYESPYRLLKTFAQLKEILGQNRLISVSREITKMYQETITGTISEVEKHFENNPIKGEFVICIKAADNYE